MKDLNVDISYVSTLPLQGDSPKVTIKLEEFAGEFKVYFIDLDKDELVTVKKCKANETITGERQWYTNWGIQIFNFKNEPIFFEKIDLKENRIFIKIDAYALGDNIAWMPYIEEFRKKHNCLVICSTFFNKLFEKVYPQILFAAPNTQILNVDAQYYIGATDELNLKYAPCISKNVPLQEVAAKSLGLEFKEIIPKIYQNTIPPLSKKEKESYHSLNEVWGDNTRFGGKYVCISEFASSSNKQWKEVGGWQMVVDFLNVMDYKVVVISKEPTSLQNIIDKTGNIDLKERIEYLEFAHFFIGVSSGLSWLSWAVGTHVVMVSDVTPKFHEFQSNITRICANDLKTVDYNAPNVSSAKTVISEIKKIL